MKSKVSVVLAHVFIWLTLITLPLLMNGRILTDLKSGNNAFVFGPFFFFNLLLIGIFYLNYFLFIPRFLFKKKYVQYFVICGLMFLLMKFVPIAVGMLIYGPPPKLTPSEIPINFQEKGRHILPMLQTSSFLMYVTVFTASIALRINSRMKELEKEKFEAQLSFLKSQINPHFLFNTLNSIYSVSLKTSPSVANMISRLSEMMRYNMHDSQMDRISLKRELENLSNYIEFQKVRVDENIELIYTIESEVGDAQITPLLLMPFVENAFKYGVNPEQKSVIMIKVSVVDSLLCLLVKNTIVEIQERDNKVGIGIENTRKRLKLMYAGKHQLSTHSENNIYSVSLEVLLT